MVDGGGGGGGGGIISGGCGGACNNLLQTAYKPTNGQDRCESTLRVYLCVCGGGGAISFTSFVRLYALERAIL